MPSATETWSTTHTQARAFFWYSGNQLLAVAFQSAFHSLKKSKFLVMRFHSASIYNYGWPLLTWNSLYNSHNKLINHPSNIHCRIVIELASLCFTSGKLRETSQLLLQLIFTHFVCASHKTNLIILLRTLNSDIMKKDVVSSPYLHSPSYFQFQCTWYKSIIRFFFGQFNRNSAVCICN